MFGKYKKKILFSLVFAAVVFLAMSLYADFDKFITAVISFDWKIFPFILSLSLANYFFRFLKWHYYLKVLEIDITLKASILIFFSAFSMSITPGKMGEVLKSFLLKEENGTSVAKSAPIVLVERLTDFISIMFLCFLGVFVFDYGRNLIIIFAVIFFGSAFILSSRKISVAIITTLEKIRFLSKISHKIHSAYDSIYLMLRFKPLVFAVLISLLAWFCECLGFYFVLDSFPGNNYASINIMSASFIYAFSTFVGAVAMLPGGLGATEASLSGLLMLLKIPKDISVAASMIIRIATLWFAVIIGIIAVFFYQAYSKKSLSGLDFDKT